MKGVIVSILMIALFQCSKNSELNCESSACATPATVIDLAGLDGCGLVFELADGTRLEPERRTYLVAPTPEEDPLYHFDLKAGQEVKIDWLVSNDLASICMTGKIIFVTCISECKKPTK